MYKYGFLYYSNIYLFSCFFFIKIKVIFNFLNRVLNIFFNLNTTPNLM